ncbi:dihydrodipicolinate synthase family protein [Paenibacillus koleovorans]|uniref:dihydrodipicolinate synthase family protein n=1 Tax=Paenibacillus koleovorans TaxID=121608 RepID=UPI0027D88D07|nr:dihydrodipicolinate synthase family protein [Paenibacillus koleovorans]
MSMEYETIAKRLETISAIPVTPFHPVTKRIDWAALEQNIHFLLEQGLQVIVPCGNTSEFYSLTLEEAKAEIAKVVEIVNGRALVVAGVGYSTETAILLGEYAQAAGADAVMIHQPIHPYATSRGVYTYFKTVIESLAIPSVLYFKDPHISDDILLQLALLPKLVGIKYAVNDLPRFAQLCRNMPKHSSVKLICGTAEKWAPFFLTAGASGFTSGLVNVHPTLSFELLQAFRSGNMAAMWAIWEKTVPFENLRAKYNNGNNVVVVKEAMNQIGHYAGATREPVDPLDERDRAEVRAILEGWGLPTARSGDNERPRSH